MTKREEDPKEPIDLKAFRDKKLGALASGASTIENRGETVTDQEVIKALAKLRESVKERFGEALERDNQSADEKAADLLASIVGSGSRAYVLHGIDPHQGQYRSGRYKEGVDAKGIIRLNVPGSDIGLRIMLDMKTDEGEEVAEGQGGFLVAIDYGSTEIPIQATITDPDLKELASVTEATGLLRSEYISTSTTKEGVEPMLRCVAVIETSEEGKQPFSVGHDAAMIYAADELVNKGRLTLQQTQS